MKCHNGLGGLFIGLISLWVTFNTASADGLHACPVKLAWDKSADDRVIGYALYYRLATAAVSNRVDVGGAQSITLTNLYAGSNYFFSLVTYDATGRESAPATAGPFSPPAMTRLRITKLADGSISLRFRSAPGSLCRIEYSPASSATPWRTLVTTNADADGNVVILDSPSDLSPKRYYRSARPDPVIKEKPKPSPDLEFES